MEISYSRKAEGVATVCGPFGEMFNVKTVTCGHCNRIMYVSPFGDGTLDVKLPKHMEQYVEGTQRKEPPAVCHQCFSLVCPRCHKDGRCTPLLQKIEEEEKRDRLLKAVGL